jgi:hypothetical protein
VVLGQNIDDGGELITMLPQLSDAGASWLVGH